MEIRKAEPMRKHTSFRVGGPALIYAVPEGREELQKLIRFLYEEKIAYRILGNGTNLLVSDQGVDFVVVEIKNRFSDVSLLPGWDSANADVCIRAGAGASLSSVAAYAEGQGLSGMEALHGIPGTVGGAVVMNAGAYGTEMKDVLESCEVLCRDGQLISLPAEDLSLSYRHSNVEEQGYIVLSAVFRLQKGDPAAIRARTEDYRERRLSKQPMELASAGSTFKRPEGAFAGKLIEDAGLKGFRMGGAQVSEKHCGFLVNAGDATAEDIYRLMGHVQERVYKQSGVWLSPEVKVWGSF